MTAIDDARVKLLVAAEKFRDATRNAFAAGGLAMTTQREEMVAEFESETNWRVTPRPRFRSPIVRYESRLGEMLVDPIPEETAAAQSLYSAFGSSCFWRQFGSGCGFRRQTSRSDEAFPGDPTTWILHNMVEPYVFEYVSTIDNLESGVPSLAAELAEELLAFAAAEMATWDTSIYLTGVSTAGQMVHADIFLLRKLEADETGALINFRGFGRGMAPRYHGYAFAHSGGPVVPATHVLTVKQAHVKESGQAPPPSLSLQRLLVGLELAGVSPIAVSERAFTLRQPAWLTTGISGSPPLIVSTSDKVRIASVPVDNAVFARAVELARKIPDSALVVPKSQQDTAIHRFMLGAARPRLVDEVLDFMICLEAALIGKDSEISFRFRHFGAAFLGTNPTERAELLAKFKRLYDLRSKLVHGNAKFPDQPAIEKAALDARDLCRRVLVKCFNDGWPSQTEFESLLLGAHVKTA